MVAGAAALVKSLKQSAMPADKLRSLLIQTGDTISSTWGGPMRRLNIDAAVRRVLPIPQRQRVFVADRDTDVDPSAPGAVIGFEVDPLTGAIAPGTGSTVVIPLRLVALTPFAVTQYSRPTTIVASPDGTRLYAAATDAETGLDAVLFISTKNSTVEAAVRLDDPSSIALVNFDGVRPAMAVSPDGRLLYVTAGGAVVIINTVNARVVRAWQDLPSPYNALSTQATTALQDRLNEIRRLVGGAAGFPAGRINALSMSSDGRILFALINTGSGPGRQPGTVIPIDVDLYRDGKTTTKTLESDLSSFLSPAATPPAIPQPGIPVVPTGDEPSALVVNPNGKRMYVFNGGFEAFETDVATPQQFEVIQTDPIYGLLDLVPTFLGFPARPVVNILKAPGFTWALGAQPGVPSGSSRFASSVAASWQPISGGANIDQFTFPHVYSARPFAAAMRPDGRRTLVGFFQTGNFGVLDLDHQGTLAVPTNGQVFGGLIAVTPALRLDLTLWPRRGAFTAFGQFLPSPDESLLFPVTMVYAQNGRFAAAAHGGVGKPHPVPITLPDFSDSSNNDVRLALNALGYSVPPGASGGSNAEGDSVSVNESKVFTRGGGALSIIDDRAISFDLATNILTAVPIPSGARPVLLGAPTVCHTRPRSTHV